VLGGLTRRIVVSAIGVALVGIAIWKAVGAYNAAQSIEHHAKTRSRLDRQLWPAHVVGIEDTSIFPKLASLMPSGSTYTVFISPNAQPTELDGYAGAFANYWLLPRRVVGPLDDPTFTLVFGTIPASFKNDPATNVGGDVNLVRSP
jgi:hypothetical protein